MGKFVDSGDISFYYNEDFNLKDYFLSYPVLKFQLKSVDESLFYYNWFPSEYLYRSEVSRYSFAAVE